MSTIVPFSSRHPAGAATVASLDGPIRESEADHPIERIRGLLLKLDRINACLRVMIAHVADETAREQLKMHSSIVDALTRVATARVENISRTWGI
jgi:hypothetical protein